MQTYNFEASSIDIPYTCNKIFRVGRIMDFARMVSSSIMKIV